MISDCLMCGGTGNVLDTQNEFYLKLLKWYAESGKSREQSNQKFASAARLDTPKYRQQSRSISSNYKCYLMNDSEDVDHMSKDPQERRTKVKEAIIKVLTYYKAGITTKEIATKVAGLHGLGRLSFEQDIDEYLRELEREGRVERVRKSRPDDSVWYGEMGSRHSFEVWRLTKEEKIRHRQTSPASA